MLVSQILKQKPQGVVTAAPDQTVADLAAILSERRIGCCVVSRDGQTVEGIVSERDIVRVLGQKGPAVLSGPISGIMTAKVVSCQSDATTDQVLRQMTDGRFRHMPVMADAHLVGLISIGDVVKARLSELAMEKDALEGMIKGF